MTQRITVAALALLLAFSVLAIAPTLPVTQAQGRVQIEFWHGLTRPLGDILEKIAADFNASQSTYQVNATFKGSYPQTMVAAIAAFRAGNAPHIVQMFEVGTATMMAARGAIKPVHEVFRDAGIPFDSRIYLPGVRGYYSTADGKLVGMPFNSSTPVFWWNKDAFRKAGLDPNKPPRTWAEVRQDAQRIRAANAAPCAFTTAWPTWTQFENFSSMQDLPFATKANGFEGLDTQLQINSPAHVRHLQLLLDMQAEGTFKYGGRDAAGDALFPAGECAMITASSALRARIVREAKFEWGVSYFPVDDDVKTVRNSIIGGAAFWVMTSPRRSAPEYKGVAEFFRYLSQPQVMAQWHMDTGYVPITHTAVTVAQASGYYTQNAGADIPIKQLTRSLPTRNSMGLRLGNMPEIRVVIQEEIERALQGQQSAKQALDAAVRRGNEILRRFQQENAP